MCSEDGESCGCCCNHSNVRTCICLPYVDSYMIAAQIIAIVAVLISWIWWVPFFIGFICFVLLQVIWCCRQNKAGLYISCGISTLAAITCAIAGIVMLVVWKDQRYCKVWVVTVTDDLIESNSYRTDDYYSRDYCKEGIWATIAFLAAILWFATTGCILYFVKSGRHTTWEEKLRMATDTTTTTTTTTAIEMGTVQHHHQEQQLTTMGTPTITDATASATTAESYVLPEIPNKIDNVC